MQVRLSVVLFSRHSALLRSLEAVLNRIQEVQVLAATDEAARLVNEVGALVPHVVVLDDYHTPDLVAICEEVKAASESTRLAVLYSPVSEVRTKLTEQVQHLAVEKPIRGQELVRRLQALAQPAPHC